MNHGWGDPLQYLNLEGVEASVASKVIQKAVDIKHDEQKTYFKALQIAVQNGVAKAFGS